MNIDNLRNLYLSEKQDKSDEDFGQRLSLALSWNEGAARVETMPSRGLEANVSRAFVGEQPAAIFISHDSPNNSKMIGEAALYAYHASVEWGIVTNTIETVVFNSHWVRRKDWFHLPPISSDSLDSQLSILTNFTPAGLTEGKIDEVAAKFYQPDQILLPVDDALVDRLDSWRDECLRHSQSIENIDTKLQSIFAQFFVLRAVEDRNLARDIPRLESAISFNEVNMNHLRFIFRCASASIQSDLFADFSIEEIPSFILSGIIRDLYKPAQLPFDGIRYNFSWIDSDVLGRAYEKYLSNLLIPKPSNTSQLQLWETPLREVERVSVQKSGGVYYTPSYLVRHLTEKSLDLFDRDNEDDPRIPIIVDISCGSGSFLTAAVDSVIRRRRTLNPERNWGKEIIENSCIVGIDNDVRAVTLARLSLWLRLAEEPSPLPLPHLEKVIVHGDSLDDATWDSLPEEYDIILGNPPFIASGNVQSRLELGKKFKTAQGKFDYSYLFVELAIKKLKSSGVLGLVVPNRIFRNRDASVLRDILTSQTNIVSLVDFGATKVFTGIKAYIGTLLLQKAEIHSESRATSREIKADPIRRVRSS